MLLSSSLLAMTLSPAWMKWVMALTPLYLALAITVHGSSPSAVPPLFVHATLGVELAVLTGHGAVEVDEHGAPVGVFTGRVHVRAHLHVVEVLDHLPEGEVLGLQAGDRWS